MSMICRARCRDGSLSVSVSACFFSCFSDVGIIAKSPPLGVAGNVANVEVLPIPMLPVFNWGAAGTRHREGGFPS